MEQETKEALIENLKSALETQSRICLELDVNWSIWETVYNKDDLINISIMFIHIVWNLSAWYCKDKWLILEQSIEVAKELWEWIRSLVKKATWFDTFEILD